MDGLEDRPVRVLHIIDTLGGGGSERLLWDIVRLSEPKRTTHRVATFFAEGLLGPFVYGEPLRQLGAYGDIAQNTARDEAATEQDNEIVAVGGGGGPSTGHFGGSDDSAPVVRTALKPIRKTIVRNLKKLPQDWKRRLVGPWNRAVSYLNRRGWKAASYSSGTLRIIKEYFRFRPDVIHVHGFYGFTYGVFFKRVFRCPIVHTVPCLFSQMEQQGTGWLIGQYRRSHRHVDYFVLDPGYRNELMGVGVPAEKLVDLIGTVDVQAITSVKDESERHRIEVRSRLGIPEDSLVALSVGRLDPTKGHSYALEALPLMLEQLPNLYWVVLGEGWKRPELEARIRELGVEKHARLVGFDGEPLPYYAAADIYLRTTTMEGENISSQQAIVMGLPTVGFDTCRETDLIGKLGHGLLVPNMDVAGLASAVVRILTLPDRGRAMGKSGIDYCRAQLDIGKQVDRLASMYASVSRCPPRNHDEETQIREIVGLK